VACYLAQLGVRAARVSRVGDDPLGALLRDRRVHEGCVVGGNAAVSIGGLQREESMPPVLGHRAW
jgi:sugar/nucleoside kinase (ribokinase family)